MMNFIKKTNLKEYLFILTIWIFIQVLIFYIFPFFVIPFVWFIMIVLLLVLIVRNLIILIKNRNLSLVLNQRLVKLTVSVILFFLTFYKANYIPSLIIEKIDWVVLFNKRKKIIEEVKNNTLYPNVTYNDFMCQLPFKFPIVSNGGNDIAIYHNDENQYTIEFYVFRDFFEAPVIRTVYSNNLKDIGYFEEKIMKDPANNWKIRDNWYRIYGD